MNTKTLHSFLHQNNAQLFATKICGAFYNKTLHNILHQITAQLFALESYATFYTTSFFKCWSDEHQNSAQFFAPKHNADFYNKTLCTFLKQIPSQVFFSVD